MNKEIIREWGENSAYSAKGHFKSADIRKWSRRSLIFINLAFAIMSLMDIEYSWLIKSLALISLFASIILLVLDSGINSKIEYEHMQIGDEYLSIHYELQKLYRKGNVEDSEIESIRKRYDKLHKKDKPMINQLAMKFAKTAIDKKGEMIPWWKDI